MKIQEITENIDPKSKQYERLIVKLFLKSLRSLIVVNNKMLQLKELSDKSLSEEQWQELLQYLDTIIGTFDKSVSLFAAYQMKKNTFNEHNLDQTLNDILLMKNTVHKMRGRLPNTLLEDIVDFKGPNDQLSAMSTKRPKTKKDTAKSEVEQLFKENKK
jgi:hypothetical protein